MQAAGLWMLALVAVVMIATGLPAFIVLIGVAVLFAVVGVAAGALPYELLTALPWRVLGLLESDLLQALPLYVLMGALLNRLPLADTLFRAGNALFARTPAARSRRPRSFCCSASAGRGGPDAAHAPPASSASARSVGSRRARRSCLSSGSCPQ